MARAKKVRLDLSAPKEYRKSLGMNQFAFWHRFGTTQSGGSRYEAGRKMPTAISMLMWLVDTGKLSEKDLAAALKAANNR